MLFWSISYLSSEAKILLHVKFFPFLSSFYLSGFGFKYLF